MPPPSGRRSLRHSAGLRFGLIHAGLFGLSAVALAALLWWSTAGWLDRRTDSDIALDAEGLSETYLVGGLPALMEAIDERITNNIDDDAVYLLTDAERDTLAGNLSGWPPGLSDSADVIEGKVDRAGLMSATRIQQFTLRGGLHLLIGRDVQVRDLISRLLTHALLWMGLATVALGVGGAVMVRGLFRGMLANVSATAAAISAGDLQRRVRLSGRGDELDDLAETINHMLDRIGRLMDGVREVSNAIAHDLRTPITRARVRLEDALRASGSEAALRQGVERAIADLDGIVAVFQALLRIAEIEAGARRAAFATFDLTPVLRDLAELYDAAAEESQHHLGLVVPPTLPCHGDREMLQQAVANLLDNALKFSPPHATVQVTAEVRPDGRIMLAVSDRGPGMCEADRARATERFFRGESARHAPGSGLGLSLVHAVAALHGGELRLEENAPGEPDPGLRAVLLLPGVPVGAIATADSPRAMQPVGA